MIQQPPPDTAPQNRRPGECTECQAPAGMHRPLCDNGTADEFTRIINCLIGRHAFTNNTPPGEKPLWECRHCGEPRITATGQPVGPARKGRVA